MNWFLPSSSLLLSSASPRRWPWYHWRRFGFNFLTISILAHLFFGVGATYLVVQTIQAKRQQTFAGAPPSANAPTHAIEHKVQLQKKQQTMSAPAPLKRITTTSNSRVALPAMPAMPHMDEAITPLAMAGMGGVGVRVSMGTGGAGTGGGANGGLNLFGTHTGGAGLAGTFYDLKQTPNRQPTNMTPDLYGKIITDFANGGFNAGLLNRFFKADQPIFATQIWIPDIPSDEGPAAFGLEKIVQPRLWCVHYKGQVTAPDSFTFHFVGAGDDVMLVKFNGRLVLDRCWYIRTRWRPQKNYNYDFSGIPDGFAKGDAIQVEAGQTYPIEVLIGEQPGGAGFATLLQEIEGAAYDKDNRGNPILPVFRMSDAEPAAGTPERPYPPHRNDGPVWKAVPILKDSSSIFDH